mmetsp:Transcript_11936/g.18220  ORF Transcript_11936/g.18220 Transcript_11936/m.18220 type:complete len:110 (-) Transcript_11936:522-851(-)
MKWCTPTTRYPLPLCYAQQHQHQHQHTPSHKTTKWDKTQGLCQAMVSGDNPNVTHNGATPRAILGHGDATNIPRHSADCSATPHQQQTRAIGVVVVPNATQTVFDELSK